MAVLGYVESAVLALPQLAALTSWGWLSRHLGCYALGTSAEPPLPQWEAAMRPRVLGLSPS